MEPTEAHEQAEEAIHKGDKRVAMLISVLAAILALLDHGAKLSQTEATDTAILASDQWNFYQAKTLRMHLLRSQADLIGTLDASPDPAKTASRLALAQSWRADADRYESDPKTGEGRKEIQEKAKVLEHRRDGALHALHAFETGVSTVQLGIVLATASIIAEAGFLVFASAGLGLVGVGFGVYALIGG
jgi:hypothetical protein